MTDITEHLSGLRARVREAAARCGRNADEIMIVAVSKQQPSAVIQRAYLAGQHHFGESYAQEAEQKLSELTGLPIIWHFIGRVQANKTRFIARHFHWVHTIDRERIAQRLDSQRPAFAAPLEVLIQVNLAGEPQKGGVAPEAAGELANRLRALPRLRLRGLMTIAPAGLAEPETLAHFERLGALRDALVAEGHALDTLSMGMSGDFEAAIAAGATCVRIGTALFGLRTG